MEKRHGFSVPFYTIQNIGYNRLFPLNTQKHVWCYKRITISLWSKQCLFKQYTWLKTGKQLFTSLVQASIFHYSRYCLHCYKSHLTVVQRVESAYGEREATGQQLGAKINEQVSISATLDWARWPAGQRSGFLGQFGRAEGGPGPTSEPSRRRPWRDH